MTKALSVLGLSSAAALFGCAATTSDASDASDGADEIAPPALEDIFMDNDFDGVPGYLFLAGEADGEPIYETRYLFDDEGLRALCLLPDADSFDDYEEIDPSGRVIIPRGTTPLSTECSADGIVTGPLHEELLPSSWCRIEGCVPKDDSE